MTGETLTTATRRKPEVNIFLHWLGRLAFRVLGFRVAGDIPDVDKAVIIAGPHTSNLDGLYMVLTSWIVRRRLDWMVKAELVRGPLGWLIRWAGGVPIDRSASFNAVEQAIQAFNQRERMLLAVAPEGTRKKKDHWKTGFYWIAVGAQVPLVIACMDHKRKAVFLHTPPMNPTGNLEQDIEVIWDYYQPEMARYPEKFNDKRLRPSQAEKRADRQTDRV